MDVLPLAASGRQLLPEIPFPPLTVGKTYRIFLQRPIRTPRGKIQHRVLHFRGLLRGIHARLDCYNDYEFACLSSSAPEILPTGHTYYLPLQSGIRPDWRAVEASRPF